MMTYVSMKIINYPVILTVNDRCQRILFGASILIGFLNEPELLIMFIPSGSYTN